MPVTGAGAEPCYGNVLTALRTRSSESAAGNGLKLIVLKCCSSVKLPREKPIFYTSNSSNLFSFGSVWPQVLDTQKKIPRGWVRPSDSISLVFNLKNSLQLNIKCMFPAKWSAMYSFNMTYSFFLVFSLQIYPVYGIVAICLP